MVIIETSIFTKRVKESLNDDDYQQLQEALIINPELGSVLRKSGGLRKVRWKLEGKGKSGGIRVIYYWKVSDSQIYMIYCYPKNELDNLTDAQVAQLKKIVERWNS
ncbi:MAG: type II toxin-antitoxin system RelE/ParE family toxin [Kangiella sp.]|nr:type II toxin-antitoxin system RelE/ParE family toxin [Kangiella sp.]